MLIESETMINFKREYDIQIKLKQVIFKISDTIF